jgi:hypothetical protein
MVWILTEGGPANASRHDGDLHVPRRRPQHRVRLRQRTIAVILFAFCFVFALCYQRFALRRDTPAPDTGRWELVRRSLYTILPLTYLVAIPIGGVTPSWPLLAHRRPCCRWWTASAPPGHQQLADRPAAPVGGGRTTAPS